MNSTNSPPPNTQKHNVITAHFGIAVRFSPSALVVVSFDNSTSSPSLDESLVRGVLVPLRLLKDSLRSLSSSAPIAWRCESGGESG
jgi:hypothetical protein